MQLPFFLHIPYFNPLPPQGGRLVRSNVHNINVIFQSTPSPRRETFVRCQRCALSVISIHSLPKEGDFQIRLLHTKNFYFNPLPPQGGRRGMLYYDYSQTRISIHSLPKEGDLFQNQTAHAVPHFNPLPPQGGRRSIISLDLNVIGISIHSLPKEGDCLRQRRL